ncbi:MAG: flavodoxin family protein [Bacteroidota bacterium]
MKVIAINGSPKGEGNTYQAMRMLGNELEAAGIEFEVLHIGNRAIRGCTACMKCYANKDQKCATQDDFNSFIPKIMEADGLVIGSPVYYSGIAGTMKCFLDRLFYISGANGNFFRHKVGAAITAVRRSGGSSTLDGLNHYLNYAEMLVATSNYWNIIHGRTPGEVSQDAEGVQIMRVLGKNMAWMLKMREATTIPEPEMEKKEITNFVR